MDNIKDDLLECLIVGLAGIKELSVSLQDRALKDGHNIIMVVSSGASYRPIPPPADVLKEMQPIRLQCSNIMRGLDLKYFGEDPEAWDMPTGKDKVLLGVGKTYHQFVQPRINGKKKKR